MKLKEMSQIMFSEGEKILNQPVNESFRRELLIDLVYDTISFHSGLKKNSVKMFRDELNQIRSHLLDTGIIQDIQSSSSCKY